MVCDDKKLNTFIQCLSSNSFKEAGRIESAIIKEETANTGLCYNFLMPKSLVKMEECSGQSCNNAFPSLSPIHYEVDVDNPDTIAAPYNTFKQYENLIIDSVNKLMDKRFIQALDECVSNPTVAPIVPATLIGAICNMMARSQKAYAVLWNICDYIEATSNSKWKDIIHPLNSFDDGWEPNFLNNFSDVRNFVSPNIPQGTIYLVAPPQSLGYLFVKESVSVAETLHSWLKPISIAIDFQMGILINNPTGVVKIQKLEA